MTKKSLYQVLDEAFQERRKENDERYALKEFEWMAKLHNRILFGLIGVILLAVLGAIIRSIGL